MRKLSGCFRLLSYVKDDPRNRGLVSDAKIIKHGHSFLPSLSIQARHVALTQGALGQHHYLVQPSLTTRGFRPGNSLSYSTSRDVVPIDCNPLFIGIIPFLVLLERQYLVPSDVHPDPQAETCSMDRAPRTSRLSCLCVARQLFRSVPRPKQPLHRREFSSGGGYILRR
ncbi:uncharacterized protein B0I36DRAFT_28275 [Microdochium trichocladiopsis]|uniref:Uncharacterized protein n=1 Tax=Microdochium trichocladiopsis TaxID=1682393 RepID=A0A9P8XXY1_9PEZI|nr:uncharacterized protein B0I36DRAFT_28275 [Microdochium trichocladiopsis]KAH7021045.1 hypothetical protein B0I36DRAFT_28275 [Microdochium trichocladiopsis]